MATLSNSHARNFPTAQIEEQGRMQNIFLTQNCQTSTPQEIYYLNSHFQSRLATPSWGKRPQIIIVFSFSWAKTCERVHKPRWHPNISNNRTQRLQKLRISRSDAAASRDANSRKLRWNRIFLRMRFLRSTTIETLMIGINLLFCELWRRACHKIANLCHNFLQPGPDVWF